MSASFGVRLKTVSEHFGPCHLIGIRIVQQNYSDGIRKEVGQISTEALNTQHQWAFAFLLDQNRANLLWFRYEPFLDDH